jgi:hypothetical protein
VSRSYTHIFSSTHSYIHVFTPYSLIPAHPHTCPYPYFCIFSFMLVPSPIFGLTHSYLYTPHIYTPYSVIPEHSNAFVTTHSYLFTHVSTPYILIPHIHKPFSLMHMHTCALSLHSLPHMCSYPLILALCIPTLSTHILIGIHTLTYMHIVGPGR